jgi:hypothetical protein
LNSGVFDRRMRFAAVCIVIAALCQLAQCAFACRAALGDHVESDLRYRQKKAERQLRDDVLDAKRHVDNGVVIHVVVRDENGKRLIPGNDAKVRIVETIGPWGGVIDTKDEQPHYIGPTRNPIVWFASEDQAAALKHDDPNVPAQLLKGSEGSGKTRVLAMLHYKWWAFSVGQVVPRTVGQSAPTKKRLKHVLDAMRELYPKRWGKYHKAEQLFSFCDGHEIQFISTKLQSESQGSPAQGYNLRALGRDEFQDQLDADNDLESRTRAAPIDRRTGKICCWQAATCTAKSSSEFRNAQARKLNSGFWIQRLLLIANSPFIDPSFLAQMRMVMTDREFRRRYFCEDLPPEHMVYYNWDRTRNLRPIPENARRITSQVLRLKTGNPRHHLLVGNDPGQSKAASILLDAFEIKGIPDPVWWARGEVFTMHKTNELHAQKVLQAVRARGCNTGHPELAHVRTHPYGQAKDKPSLDVIRIFKKVGLDVKSAQYKKDGTGTGTIKLEDRIEMVNTLLFNAAGVTRLNVEADSQGQPKCPRLVQAFETMERDVEGKAETEKKTELDLSDPPAGLGYGLWPWEKEAAALLRIRGRLG